MKFYLNKYKEVVLILLICIGCIQTYILLNSKQVKLEESAVEVVSDLGTKFTLSEIVREVNNIEGMNVVQIESINSKKINVELAGDIDNILNKLEEIKKYPIGDFNVIKSNGNYSLILSLLVE